MRKKPCEDQDPEMEPVLSPSTTVLQMFKAMTYGFITIVLTFRWCKKCHFLTIVNPHTRTRVINHHPALMDVNITMFGHLMSLKNSSDWSSARFHEPLFWNAFQTLTTRWRAFTRNNLFIAFIVILYNEIINIYPLKTGKALM